MCEPDRIDSPTQCDVLRHGGRDDLRGRQPDALVDHLEAGVAGADGDLLGAVGVAVEAGLADQQPQPAGRARSPVARDRARAPRRARRRRRPRPTRAGHPGRRAVLAEDLAQRAGPLARRGPGPGARRGWPASGSSSVFAASRERGQRRRRPRPASRCARQARERRRARPPRPPGRRPGSRRRGRRSAGTARSSSKRLTPTTMSSPDSIRPRRAACDATSACFM